MKTMNYKLLLFVFFIPLALLANNGKKKWKHTEEKTYHKEYDVNANAMLKINNTFGNVNISSWNQNQVVIDVLIKVGGNNKEKVKEQIDKIKVNFSATSSLVEAITDFERKKMKWKKNKYSSIQINYTVKVPKSNQLKIKNSFGNILVDETNGVSSISCDFGKVILGKLNAKNNDVNLDYCPGSTIEYLNIGEINADYSGVVVQKSGEVELNADYSTVTFKENRSLVYNGDYGTISMGKAGKVVGEGDYMTFKAEELENELIIEGAYGAVKINKLSNQFRKIVLNTNYTGIDIKHDASSFDFDIKSSYGNINLDKSATFTNKHKAITNSHYQGHVGSGNSGNNIVVKSAYGNVSIKNK